MQNKIFIFLYLFALVGANLIVNNFGSYGLWISSFILIPFDFICRCIFHETWQGKKLIKNLILLTLVSGMLTVLINFKALNIALASFCGIVAVQIFTGLFYQFFIKSSYFVKVNGSDIIGIIVDSIVFQYVAFNVFLFSVTGGQILIKILGGLMWYFIIFKMFKFKPKS